MSKKVYQIKITLKNFSPTIWRRILIDESCTFDDLHLAIQASMGWTNSHLYGFYVPDPSGTRGRKTMITLIDEAFDDDLDSAVEKLKNYEHLKKIQYEYDFGDGWDHQIIIEKVLEKTSGEKYPKCIAGERACPPEDIGGTFGYANFLDAISDPKHPDHEDMLDWCDENFDPEKFNPEDVKFQ